MHELLEQDVQEGIERHRRHRRRRLVVDDHVAAFIHFDMAVVQQKVPHRNLQ